MTRSVPCGVAVLAGFAGIVWLLTREETQLWLLISTGLAAGAVAGGLGLRRGVLGIVIGAAAGATVGVLAPFVYIPLWLMFDLPPYNCDL